MTRANATLAAVAGLLGVGAAAVGGARGRTVGSEPLPAAVAGHETSALEVAAWLRARRPDLTILDVRPDSEAFAGFHLPRARHVPIGDLRRAVDSLTGTLVVYADGGDLAARAWVVLTALGQDSVRVLADGVREWLTDVLNPTLADDASDDRRRAFTAQADLSRYFGGLPRIVPAGSMPQDENTAGLLRRTSRRGCAF